LAVGSHLTQKVDALEKVTSHQGESPSAGAATHKDDKSKDGAPETKPCVTKSADWISEQFSLFREQLQQMKSALLGEINKKSEELAVRHAANIMPRVLKLERDLQGECAERTAAIKDLQTSCSSVGDGGTKSSQDTDCLTLSGESPLIDAALARQKAVLAAQGDLPSQLRAEFTARLEQVDAALHAEINQRVEQMTNLSQDELSNRISTLDADLHCEMASLASTVQSQCKELSSLASPLSARILATEQDLRVLTICCNDQAKLADRVAALESVTLQRGTPSAKPQLMDANTEDHTPLQADEINESPSVHLKDDPQISTQLCIADKTCDAISMSLKEQAKLKERIIDFISNVESTSKGALDKSTDSDIVHVSPPASPTFVLPSPSKEPAREIQYPHPDHAPQICKGTGSVSVTASVIHCANTPGCDHQCASPVAASPCAPIAYASEPEVTRCATSLTRSPKVVASARGTSPKICRVRTSVSPVRQLRSANDLVAVASPVSTARVGKASQKATLGIGLDVSACTLQPATPVMPTRGHPSPRDHSSTYHQWSPEATHRALVARFPHLKRQGPSFHTQSPASSTPLGSSHVQSR